MNFTKTKRYINIILSVDNKLNVNINANANITIVLDLLPKMKFLIVIYYVYYDVTNNFFYIFETIVFNVYRGAVHMKRRRR